MSTNEWFTPPGIIADVRQVLGGIDLDPASCTVANAIVQANQFFSKKDNGLMHPWTHQGQPACVYLNPPYGKTGQGGASNLEVFTRYLLNEYALGHVCTAILLIPANTATSWFDLLWQFPICFPRKRIRFVQESGAASDGVSFGTCFVYLGPDHRHFTNVFSKYGHVVQPSTEMHYGHTRMELWQQAG